MFEAWFEDFINLIPRNNFARVNRDELGHESESSRDLHYFNRRIENEGLLKVAGSHVAYTG